LVVEPLAVVGVGAEAQGTLFHDLTCRVSDNDLEEFPEPEARVEKSNVEGPGFVAASVVHHVGKFERLVVGGPSNP
jgi:hypothetical protein